MLAFGWHLLIANLRVSAVVPKSDVLQIILDLVQGVPYYMLIMILMFIFQKFLSHCFFGQIWSLNLDLKFGTDLDCYICLFQF